MNYFRVIFGFCVVTLTFGIATGGSIEDRALLPIAPQNFDGFNGVPIEPFSPGPRIRKVWNMPTSKKIKKRSKTSKRRRVFRSKKKVKSLVKKRTKRRRLFSKRKKRPSKGVK